MICDIGVSLTVIMGLVASQEYLEERRNPHYHSYLKEIPKKFQIQGSGAPSQFLKHYKDIEALAKNENMTILYDINVEILKPFLKQSFKKALYKKGKSKKYNVPLKKNSMKLSPFEMLLRKMAEEAAHNAQRLDKYVQASTEKQKALAPKLVQMKYKPIISRVRTNYTKIVKPVRNKEIILTV
ncbi:hypothetical protein K1T71_006854 [Dendrolimus kikuchii]|uniref:Uncharacterized protein n=1 Tax=Dendrolimus kikuchii TaxID=765133 RepID=A0ACC1D2C4_9NEOP|nr:hypothetical protein K1T71_006854 [Dendrolimus kikuchii]